MQITTHPDFDNHEMVVHCTDRATGLRAFIAIHDTALGPGMGGCRMKPYSSEEDALRDVLRLSRGMTYKYAASGLSYGGAKAVIIDDAIAFTRSERLLAFGRIVEKLGGLYTTAEDVGISTEDVRLLSTVTQHVRNLPMEDTGDGALCTAWGVFHGIQAGLEHRGFSGFAGRKIAVEGLGKVGMALCGLLHDAGAKLIVSDIDEEKVETARLQYAATAVAAGDIHRADADVYAPCALGAVLNPATIPEIRARIVAGAANNQLSNPSQDRVLRARGVTYCPDYVVNAGGVLSVADKDGVFTRAAALKRVATILATTRRVLALAETENIPTGEAADRMVHRRLRT
ncbi:MULTISPECIES: Leu/Phe/Val dehydrogenase [Paraburkholderia]|uniref:Leu/Phe/Val dehydrogenase n=1 Tax=Paraburkholderia TaxID=1822464 RepID=UPI0038B72FC5